MTLATYEQIMKARDPSEIFTMNPRTLKEEYDSYCKMYEYGQTFQERQVFPVRGLTATAQLHFLYKKALEALSDEENVERPKQEEGSPLLLYDNKGNLLKFEYYTHIFQRVCDTYLNDEQILMVIPALYEERYGFVSNFLEKVRAYFDFWRGKQGWSDFQYAVPSIIKSFKIQDNSGYAFLLQKPCKIYPLREVLNYFNGRMNVRHVISIIKRLYLHACYFEIAGMTHNAICVDNIYFSPGNEVLPGHRYSVEDIRIVGLYGGWFFTTNKNEEVKAFPQEVSDCIPRQVKKNKHSTSEVDVLAIMKVARELLGDATGKNLFGVNSELCDWFNRDTCEENVLKDFSKFEQICKNVYGEPTFIDIDVPT